MTALLGRRYEERCLWQAQASPPPGINAGLPASADVVVVGGGLCGLAAAEVLARRGRHVLVLEKEPLGWGASSRNGGMVIPELKAGPVALQKAYGTEGARMYREAHEAFDLVEAMAMGTDGRGGIACDYLRSGQLHLAHTERHVGDLEAMAREHARLGEDVRFVPRSELGAEIGSDAYAAGVVFERTGALHPARFHAGVADRALADGAEVHDRTAVTSIERAGSGHRVDTTRGAVRAAEVVVATNGAVDTAVPELAARVLPVGSYTIATEVLSEDLARSVSPTGRMMVDTRNFLNYWRLTPDRRMAFGGRHSLDPTDVPEARDRLYDRMRRVHPQLDGVAVEFAWGGNVAITLDRMPHVGLLDGTWYATGCNGSGVAMLTWLGHRLAQHVLGEAPLPAVAGLAHRRIPWRSGRAAWLPVVSRALQFMDRR